MSCCHFEDFFVNLHKAHDLLLCVPASSIITVVSGIIAVVDITAVAGVTLLLESLRYSSFCNTWYVK
jgi:hypothetical protein